MADKKDGDGAASGGKSMLPWIIAIAALMLAAATGVVVMTSPGKEKKLPEIDIDTLAGVQWQDKLQWTFNPRGKRGSKIAKLSIYFVFKAVDESAASAHIEEQMPRARARVNMLLMTKSVDDLDGEGVIHLKDQLVEELNTGFFKEGGGKVSDVYIVELLFQ